MEKQRSDEGIQLGYNTLPEVCFPARLALFLLRVYKKTISPLWGPACRFSPTCSEYAAGAIRTHGLLKGTWFASRRLLRCHPFHPGGYDPVPRQEESR